MEKKIRIVIIEDIEDDRIWLRERIEETFSETVEIVGEAGSVTKAIELIKTTQPDAALMDIKLIGGNAFDILEALKRKNIKLPKIAFMTAFSDLEYREKAINDYQNVIVNFIRRPYVEDWEARLERAFDAISLALESSPKPETEPPPPLVSVSTEVPTYSIERISGHHVRINHADICYLEADGHYEHIYLSNGKRLHVNKSMEKCLKEYPSLIQISKSHAINKEFFEKTCFDEDRNLVVILKGIDKKLKIGEKYRNFIAELKPK
jgi:two-component system, LytTR family, response regulator